MARTVAIVVAVVELHGVVPIVFGGECGKAVVAGSACRELHVGHIVAAEVNLRGSEQLAGDVVEVVLRSKEHTLVVALAEVFHAHGCHVGVVLAAHVVGHEVDDNFQPGAVSTSHQGFELFHAMRHAHGQIGVDVVVVGDGIRAAGLTFNYIGIVHGDAEARVVGRMGMLNHTGVPHVGGTKLANLFQHLGRDGIELTTAIFGNGAVGHRLGGIVGEQARKQLVNDWLGFGDCWHILID